MSEPINIERFCGVDDYREYLNASWRDGGKLYATNGHFMVEIADDGREAVSRDKHPDCAALFVKNVPGEFQPMPKLSAAMPCGCCNGKGIGYRETCQDCDGKGEFEHGMYDYDCKHCDGEGFHFYRDVPEGVKESRCTACYGLGEEVLRDQGTKFGPQTFATRLLRVLSTLPGIEIASCAGDKPPLWFRFDGGRGLVMPMNV